MQTRISKDFLLIAIFAFFIANVSYGQFVEWGPRDNDVIKKVNIINDSNYDKLFIDFTPGGKRVLDAHKKGVIENEEDKEFLKSGQKFHYGFDRAPVKGEELQIKTFLFWENKTQRSFQAYILDKEGNGKWVIITANFEYRPNDKEVDITLTVEDKWATIDK